MKLTLIVTGEKWKNSLSPAMGSEPVDLINISDAQMDKSAIAAILDSLAKEMAR